MAVLINYWLKREIPHQTWPYTMISPVMTEAPNVMGVPQVCYFFFNSVIFYFNRNLINHMNRHQ